MLLDRTCGSCSWCWGPGWPLKQPVRASVSGPQRTFTCRKCDHIGEGQQDKGQNSRAGLVQGPRLGAGQPLVMCPVGVPRSRPETRSDMRVIGRRDTQKPVPGSKLNKDGKEAKQGEMSAESFKCSLADPTGSSGHDLCLPEKGSQCQAPIPRDTVSGHP